MAAYPYDRHAPAGRTLSNQTQITTISEQPGSLKNYAQVSRSRETVNSQANLTMYGHRKLSQAASKETLASAHGSQSHGHGNAYKAPLSGQNSFGSSSLNKMIADPTHPCHHNNIFEVLHELDLTKEEKTERLLSLLRKSQSKQRHWSTGLCNCCSSGRSKKHLLWQCLLGPIYQGCQAERMGEDFFTGCCMGSFLGLPVTCLPFFNGNGAMIALRSKVRERHNILGAIFEDWLIYICCLGTCANVQVAF